MYFSITGFSYLFLSFALGYFNYRTFKYWQKEKTIVSKLWFFISLLAFLFAFFRAIAGLFFFDNPSILKTSIIINSIIQILALSVISYFNFYIKFSSRLLPWLGFCSVFILGLISTFLIIFIPFSPFLEPSGSINWGLSSSSFIVLLTFALKYFLFLIVFIPLIIINYQQFKNASDVFLKRRALTFIIFGVFIIVISMLDFFVISVFKTNSIWRDLAIVIATFFLLIALFSNKEKN